MYLSTSTKYKYCTWPQPWVPAVGLKIRETRIEHFGARPKKCLMHEQSNEGRAQYINRWPSSEELWRQAWCEPHLSFLSWAHRPRWERIDLQEILVLTFSFLMKLIDLKNAFTCDVL